MWSWALLPAGLAEVAGRKSCRLSSSREIADQDLHDWTPRLLLFLLRQALQERLKVITLPDTCKSLVIAQPVCRFALIEIMRLLGFAEHFDRAWAFLAHGIDAGQVVIVPA